MPHVEALSDIGRRILDDDLFTLSQGICAVFRFAGCGFVGLIVYLFEDAPDERGCVNLEV